MPIPNAAARREIGWLFPTSATYGPPWWYAHSTR
jgi:hypothetical protein